MNPPSRAPGGREGERTNRWEGEKPFKPLYRGGAPPAAAATARRRSSNIVNHRPLVFNHMQSSSGEGFVIMFGKNGSTGGKDAKANGAARQERPDADPTPRSGRIQHSIIGAGTTLTGDLFGNGDITVEGTVEGSIECRVLTLSGEPTINGSVEADAVHVCGTFNGDVRASKVVLDKQARMTGNLTYEILEVHPGACFEGKVERRSAQRAKASKSTKTLVSNGHDHSEDPDPPSQPTT